MTREDVLGLTKRAIQMSHISRGATTLKNIGKIGTIVGGRDTNSSNVCDSYDNVSSDQ